MYRILEILERQDGRMITTVISELVKLRCQEMRNLYQHDCRDIL
jgi:hypothetical protein